MKIKSNDFDFEPAFVFKFTSPIPLIFMPTFHDPFNSCWIK